MSGGGYDPREMLSDAVATLVFMPTKFERTTYTLAEKFNFSVHDVNTLTVCVWLCCVSRNLKHIDKITNKQEGTTDFNVLFH